MKTSQPPACGWLALDMPDDRLTYLVPIPAHNPKDTNPMETLPERLRRIATDAAANNIRGRA